MDTNARVRALLLVSAGALALFVVWCVGAFLWGIYVGFSAGRSGEPTDWYLWWCFTHLFLAAFAAIATAAAFGTAVD